MGVGGTEKHEIYATELGGHLFYDLFLQGGGMAPSPPPPDSLLLHVFYCRLFTNGRYCFQHIRVFTGKVMLSQLSVILFRGRVGYLWYQVPSWSLVPGPLWLVGKISFPTHSCVYREGNAFTAVCHSVQREGRVSLVPCPFCRIWYLWSYVLSWSRVSLVPCPYLQMSYSPNTLPLADPRGGARDARPPWGSKFFHFHAVFGKNNK